MNTFLATAILAIVLCLVMAYARSVINTYRSGSQFYGLGPMSHNMANRRVWAAILIGISFILIWIYFLVERSPYMEAPGLWAHRGIVGKLPPKMALLVYRRFVVMGIIGVLLSGAVAWLILLAFFDFVELAKRYHKALFRPRHAQRTKKSSHAEGSPDGPADNT